jgi:hypothetical protein
VPVGTSIARVRVLGDWGRSQSSGRRPLGLLRHLPSAGAAAEWGERGVQPPSAHRPIGRRLKRPALRLAGHAPTALPDSSTVRDCEDDTMRGQDHLATSSTMETAPSPMQSTPMVLPSGTTEAERRSKPQGGSPQARFRRPLRRPHAPTHTDRRREVRVPPDLPRWAEARPHSRTLRKRGQDVCSQNAEFLSGATAGCQEGNSRTRYPRSPGRRATTLNPNSTDPCPFLSRVVLRWQSSVNG